jgi:hypothetical protein
MYTDIPLNSTVVNLVSASLSVQMKTVRRKLGYVIGSEIWGLIFVPLPVHSESHGFWTFFIARNSKYTRKHNILETGLASIFR